MLLDSCGWSFSFWALPAAPAALGFWAEAPHRCRVESEGVWQAVRSGAK